MSALGLCACDSKTSKSDAGTDGGAGARTDGGNDGGGVINEPALEQGDGVSRATATLGTDSVDLYTWMDSKGRPRTVSLKRQGASNGGYALQMTYQVPAGADWRTVTVNGTGGGESGFGYFVAHELNRSLSDGSYSTLAALHGEDDSPLGYSFPVVGSHSAITASSTSISHTFTTRYPKWGTKVPLADVTLMNGTPAALEAHQKFELPLTLRWVFEKGTDFPRIDIQVDMSAAVAGQLSFDVRGPYGTVEFADADANATLNNVQWGDSKNHFTTRATAAGDLLTSAEWTWNEPIGDTRKYHGLLAHHSSSHVLYEIGLVELKLGADSGLVYGFYTDNNGTSKVLSGRALLSADFADGVWSFQSAQYDGLTAATPATGKKFAWGSTQFYGSQLTAAFIAGTSVPLDAFPASHSILYRTCLVLGVSPYSDALPKSLARVTAESAAPSCALADPL